MWGGEGGAQSSSEEGTVSCCQLLAGAPGRAQLGAVADLPPSSPQSGEHPETTQS